MPWKYWNGEIIPSEEYDARKWANVQSSDLPFPMVISDQIEVKSMVDGQMYTSKRALRASYRAKGYIEIGNEQQKPAPKKKADQKSIRDSIRRAAARVGVSL